MGTLLDNNYIPEPALQDNLDLVKIHSQTDYVIIPDIYNRFHSTLQTQDFYKSLSSALNIELQNVIDVVNPIKVMYDLDFFDGSINNYIEKSHIENFFPEQFVKHLNDSGVIYQITAPASSLSSSTYSSGSFSINGVTYTIPLTLDDGTGANLSTAIINSYYSYNPITNPSANPPLGEVSILLITSSTIEVISQYSSYPYSINFSVSSTNTTQPTILGIANTVTSLNTQIQNFYKKAVYSQSTIVSSRGSTLSYPLPIKLINRSGTLNMALKYYGGSTAVSTTEKLYRLLNVNNFYSLLPNTVGSSFPISKNVEGLQSLSQAKLRYSYWDSGLTWDSSATTSPTFTFDKGTSGVTAIFSGSSGSGTITLTSSSVDHASLGYMVIGGYNLTFSNPTNYSSVANLINFITLSLYNGNSAFGGWYASYPGTGYIITFIWVSSGLLRWDTTLPIATLSKWMFIDMSLDRVINTKNSFGSYSALCDIDYLESIDFYTEQTTKAQDQSQVGVQITLITSSLGYFNGLEPASYFSGGSYNSTTVGQITNYTHANIKARFQTYPLGADLKSVNYSTSSTATYMKIGTGINPNAFFSNQQTYLEDGTNGYSPIPSINYSNLIVSYPLNTSFTQVPSIPTDLTSPLFITSIGSNEIDNNFGYTFYNVTFHPQVIQNKSTNLSFLTSAAFPGSYNIAYPTGLGFGLPPSPTSGAYTAPGGVEIVLYFNNSSFSLTPPTTTPPTIPLIYDQRIIFYEEFNISSGKYDAKIRMQERDSGGPYHDFSSNKQLDGVTSLGYTSDNSYLGTDQNYLPIKDRNIFNLIPLSQGDKYPSFYSGQVSYFNLDELLYNYPTNILNTTIYDQAITSNGSYVTTNSYTPSSYGPVTIFPNPPIWKQTIQSTSLSTGIGSTGLTINTTIPTLLPSGSLGSKIVTDSPIITSISATLSDTANAVVLFYSNLSSTIWSVTRSPIYVTYTISSVTSSASNTIQISGINYTFLSVSGNINLTINNFITAYNANPISGITVSNTASTILISPISSSTSPLISISGFVAGTIALSYYSVDLIFTGTSYLMMYPYQYSSLTSFGVTNSGSFTYLSATQLTPGYFPGYNGPSGLTYNSLGDNYLSSSMTISNNNATNFNSKLSGSSALSQSFSFYPSTQSPLGAPSYLLSCESLVTSGAGFSIYWTPNTTSPTITFRYYLSGDNTWTVPIPLLDFGLSVTPSTGVNILTWNSIPGAIGYNIYSSASPNPYPTTITPLGSSLPTTTGITYSHTVGVGTYYVITAVLNSGESLPSGQVYCVPGTPTGLNPLVVGKNNSINVSWIPVNGGIPSYQIYWKAGTGVTTGVYLGTATTYSKNYTIAGLTNGQLYSVIIVATSSLGITTSLEQDATPYLTSSTPTPSSWYQFTMSWLLGKEPYIYINGKLQITSSVYAGGQTAQTIKTAGISVGTYTSNPLKVLGSAREGSTTYLGALTNIAIYNRRLSIQEAINISEVFLTRRLPLFNSKDGSPALCYIDHLLGIASAKIQWNPNSIYWGQLYNSSTSTSSTTNPYIYINGLNATTSSIQIGSNTPSVITEAGLFDSNDNLLAYANFPPIIYNPSKYHIGFNLLISQTQ